MSDKTNLKIREAAIRCIERQGAKDVTIEDVAQEAGVTRMTVYRKFKSRSELFGDVALFRFKMTGQSIADAMASQPTFADAIVHAAVLVTKIKNDDPILGSIIYANDPFWLEELIVSNTSRHRSEIESAFMEVYGPTFERGLANGELRSDLSLGQIADWLRSFHLILYFRKELTYEEMTEFAYAFLIPSIAPAAPQQTPVSPRSKAPALSGALHRRNLNRRRSTSSNENET